MQYINRYDEQLAWAKRLTDAELLAFHSRYKREDDEAYRMGGRGLIDDPAWNAVKDELVTRGVALPPL